MTDGVAPRPATLSGVCSWERRLQLVEADRFDHTGVAAGAISAGPDRFFNQWARFRCRFAADGGE
jgi:hypothetical protein